MWVDVERGEGKINMISSTLASAQKCHVANPNWSYEVLQPQTAADIKYSIHGERRAGSIGWRDVIATFVGRGSDISADRIPLSYSQLARLSCRFCFVEEQACTTGP
jgi:hypothetical protein